MLVDRAIDGEACEERENSVAYLGRIVLLVILFEFLFNPSLTVGWLGKRFLPVSHALDLAAIAVTVTGVTLAILGAIVSRRELVGHGDAQGRA